MKQRSKPSEIDTFAVDADIIAYRCAAVCESDEEVEVYKTIDEFIFNLARDTGITKMVMFMSPSKNFRYDVATTRPYKATRHKCAYWQTNEKGKHVCAIKKRCKYAPNFFGCACEEYYTSSPRPKWIEQAKNYIREIYNAVVYPNYEADDSIASYITRYKNAAHAGMDKDIKNIQGWHYDFVKKEWEHTDSEESVVRLYRQVCTGDSTDSIVGIPGVGVKKAEKAIQFAETAEQDAKLLFYKSTKEILNLLTLTKRKIAFRAKKAEVSYDEWVVKRIDEYYEEQLKLITMVSSLYIPYKKYITVEPPPIFEDKHEEGDFEGFETVNSEFKNML